MSDNALTLETRLRAAFAPLRLRVRDDSAPHAGHAGAGDGSHLSVYVVAERFRGLRSLERHRLVYAAAGDLLPHRVHALQVQALAPEESNPESVPS